MGKEWERRIFVVGSYPDAGRIILADGFEDLLKWDKSGTGTDFVVQKSQTEVYSGSYSLQMKTRATDSTIGDNVKAYRGGWCPVHRGLHLECKFWYDDIDNLETLRFRMAMYTAAYKLVAGVGIVGDGYLQYLKSDGTWGDLSGTLEEHVPGFWNHITLEANFISKTYGKVSVNHVEHDLSDKAIRSASYGQNTSLYVEIEVISGTTWPPTVYIDDFLILEI